MAKNKKWVVVTDGEQPISKVKMLLIKSGFTVENVLSDIGCITGFASVPVANKLRTIPGVTDISQEPPQIQIGHPAAPIS